jgi:hypothetical protein
MPKSENPLTALFLTALSEPEKLPEMARGAVKETVGVLLETAGVRLQQEPGGSEPTPSKQGR